ncbi:hypothetical protein K1718_10545 [Roseibium porphyridii]|uniref:N-acetyltransferase domain-containing protein n=1 Tax=Roseibium porphyridii TaxID=2866279 RepID=A0ABY8FGT0_9HYPH|nr:MULTISPECIES: hypothetical protein [Stappiaceae]QFT31161.1 hypothetical protein FIV00_11785 [Labrenzia sp. THAF82]WFE91773.1 hypothetical protein K1718_10545 [Roseibium sp. KMA01]
MVKLRSEVDPIRLKRAWGAIDSAFARQGLTLHRGHDFDQIDRMAERSGLKILEAHFSPRTQTFSSGRAFWLGVTDVKDKLVGRVCARLDQIRPPQTLADYWRKHFYRCFPAETGGQVELAEEQPRFAEKITGDTVYMGGTEVRPEWQNSHLGGMLNRIAQIEALDEWDADFYYGWMEKRVFKDGFLRSCGFTRLHANAVRWQAGGPIPIDNDLYLAGNERDDVLDMIDQILSAPPKAIEDRISAQNLPASETSKPAAQE